MKYNNKKIYLSISLAFFFFLILINPLNAQSNLTKDTSELATAAALAELPAYLRALYKIGISVVVGLATVVMMWGGLQWIMAGGNMSRVENAKNLIYSSVLGLVIALSSFVLLNTINPQLVTPNIEKLDDVTSENLDLKNRALCCETPDGDYVAFRQIIAFKGCEDYGDFEAVDQEKCPELVPGGCLSHSECKDACFMDKSKTPDRLIHMFCNPDTNKCEKTSQVAAFGIVDLETQFTYCTNCSIGSLSCPEL